MLDLIMGNAPDAFSCGEPFAWFRPFRRHHLAPDCTCGENPCHIWERIKSVPESQFHATVFKKFGVNYVSDSSKELCWLIDTQTWADHNGIRVVNLLLWKDPIDLVYSHWKRDHSLNSWRRHFLSYYNDFFSAGLPFMSVYFNELVRDPARKIEDICSAIDMPYFAGKERFWEKRHHALYGSLDIQQQLKAGQSTIRPANIYTQEFAAHITALSAGISADAKITQTIEILRATEVSAPNGTDASAFGPHSLSRPLWYYARKAQGIYRRQILRRRYPVRKM